MKKKLLHITHVQDLDGKACAMLSRALLTSIYDCEFLEVTNNRMKDTVNEVLDNHYKYDKIIVTDLDLGDDIFKRIDTISGATMKVMVFDHHETSYTNSYKYPWLFTDERSMSAAMVYFKWWLKDFIETPNEGLVLERFCKNVSDYDTFTFKNNGNETAELINICFWEIGAQAFEEEFQKMAIDYTYESEFYKLVNSYITEIQKRQKYIDYAKNVTKYFEEDGKTIAMLWSDHKEYKNEIGYQVCRDYDVDFIIIIDPNLNSAQVRAYKDNSGSLEYCKKFGGGGHENGRACGFPMTPEQRVEYYKQYIELPTIYNLRKDTSN